MAAPPTATALAGPTALPGGFLAGGFLAGAVVDVDPVPGPGEVGVVDAGVPDDVAVPDDKAFGLAAAGKAA